MKIETKGKIGKISSLGGPSRLKLQAAGRGLVRLVLCGLFSLAAVQPAMAAHKNNASFMVSVQVVHVCQYQIRNQPQQSSAVHVVMNGCSTQPQIITRGFATSVKQGLAGKNTTRYLLRKTHKTTGKGTRYIEINF